MRLKIIFIFLIFNLVLFFAYAENIIYKIDDGAIGVVGTPANSYRHVFVNIYFSFETIFEQGTDSWTQKHKSEGARNYLHVAFLNYVNKVFFPKHTLEELLEIIADENSTLFLDGFMEYIKDNEGLSNVRITSLRMVLRMVV